MTALPQMVTPPGAASSHRRDPVGPAVDGDLPPPCSQGLGAPPPAGGAELRERPLHPERVATPHTRGYTACGRPGDPGEVAGVRGEPLWGRARGRGRAALRQPVLLLLEDDEQGVAHALAETRPVTVA